MKGLFITGTDTGAGKTILCACLLAAIAAAGEEVRAHKPAVTGLDEPEGDWPADHELLGWVAGIDPETVSPLRYGPAVSPHLAAELAGNRIDPVGVLARARAAGERLHAPAEPAGPEHPILIVEGVGGLLVPLTEEFAVRDLARELGLPVLIAAGPGLGTINHSLLTLQSARAAGLHVPAVVLTPWPEHPSEMEISNRETIGHMGAVEVATLRRLAPPGIALSEAARAELARAGNELPWRGWLGGAVAQS